MPITHKIAAVRRRGEPPSGGGENAVPTAGEIAAERRRGMPVFTGEELPPSAAGRAAVWRRRKRRAHGGEIAGVHRREQKGTGHRMVSCPLLTPLTFLCADTSKMCSETGVTGARFRASGRFWDAVMP